MSQVKGIWEGPERNLRMRNWTLASEQLEPHFPLRSLCSNLRVKKIGCFWWFVTCKNRCTRVVHEVYALCLHFILQWGGRGPLAQAYFPEVKIHLICLKSSWPSLTVFLPWTRDFLPGHRNVGKRLVCQHAGMGWGFSSMLVLGEKPPASSRRESRPCSPDPLKSGSGFFSFLAVKYLL